MRKMTERDRLLISCCSTDEQLGYLRRPFIQGGWTAATDAHAILAVPAKGTDYLNYAETDKPDISKYMDAECEEFMEIDRRRLVLKFNRLRHEYKKLDFECPECDGGGRVKWQYRTKNECAKTYQMEGECPVCHGEGGVNVGRYYNRKEYCILTEPGYGLSIPRLRNIADTMRVFEKDKCMLLRQAREHVPCYHIREKEFRLVLMPVMIQEL